MTVTTRMLGQAGVLLEHSGTKIIIDPYLSNSVERLHDRTLKRQVAVPFKPEEVTTCDWILITHIHTDHCDPDTLPIIAKASSTAKFVGPPKVLNKLKSWGINRTRLISAPESTPIDLSGEIQLTALPAAHPTITRDKSGRSESVGYVIKIEGYQILHTGDTTITEEYLDILKQAGPIKAAFLPVNEKNFFRDRDGIIGNMSVREAFLLADELKIETVVPIHWDMFAANEVKLSEIEAVYSSLNPSFHLLINPKRIDVKKQKISVVIRTLNESKHLGALLESIKAQATDKQVEIIVVDSGSTDRTLTIAKSYECKILHISKQEFSFGRALNKGCAISAGQVLVFVSGHCIPTDNHWLENLSQPIFSQAAEYTYGRQIGNADTKFSEQKIFEKYFPEKSKGAVPAFFCNNANAAISRSTWEKYQFNTSLTGLEDMELGNRLVSDGGKILYRPSACVEHLHDESWSQVQKRFEREAIALQYIMPNIHVTIFDSIRYCCVSIALDLVCATKQKMAFRNCLGIIKYRLNQYIGTFKGNNDHRKLSEAEKEVYFYPKNIDSEIGNHELHNSLVTTQSQ